MAIIRVTAGQNLQAALDAAKSGDTILTEATATFEGTFELRNKPGIVTVKSDGALPSRRVTARDEGIFTKLVSSTVEPAVRGVGASGWRLEGLQVLPTRDGLQTAIAFEDAKSIALDRMLFTSPETVGQRRAIQLNGSGMTVSRSHVAGVWDKNGQDSQAIAIWNGPGPYMVTDNFLEAASENMLVGGADSASDANVPAHITVTKNHFSKDLKWQGKPRGVKNLFELKCARYVSVVDNTFENCWEDAQKGTAIVFTVRNQDGTAPWSEIRNVLFERNIVRNTKGVFNILGYDNEQRSGRATDIALRNNLCVGSGVFLEAGGEVGTLEIDHCTVDQSGNFCTLYKGAIWPAASPGARPALFAIETLTIKNTLANHAEYGVWGEDAPLGIAALDQLTRGYTWQQVVLAGGNLYISYPSSTIRPPLASHRSQYTHDYGLVQTSLYRGWATDGSDLGRQR